MRRSKAIRLTISVAVLVSCALIVFSREPDKASDEFRNKFINEFHRTGLSTAPGDAMMLRILVESRNAKRGIEIGAARGFGAINMGIAFERTGGHLWTLEIDPRSATQTRQNLEKVGLEKTVTCIEGNALETLPTMKGEYDFVFIDAAKNEYLQYLKIIEPKLKPGAVVVADNVIKTARAMQDFLDYIQTSPNYDTVTIRASMEKGDGMTISYKIR